MFAKQLTRSGHVTRFTVTGARSGGWELIVEQDSRVVRRVSYTDWHRVERALRTVSDQVRDLEASGWREVPAQ